MLQDVLVCMGVVCGYVCMCRYVWGFGCRYVWGFVGMYRYVCVGMYGDLGVNM